MTSFGDCFEKIFVITLDAHAERRERLLRQLNEQGVYPPKVEFIRAVHGDTVGVPAWWQSGGGAWGCLQSHSQVIQRAAMDMLDNFLVLEDDAVLSRRFDQQLQEIWPHLPEDWDQIYLGGQNLLEPVPVSKFWTKCLDVNRTHAYALKRRVYQQVYAHIQYAPDYIKCYGDGWFPHIDHQLGMAHKRGDWKVYGLKNWLFGQGENWSWINGRWHPEKWWDWQQDNLYQLLPYVIVENDGLFRQIRGKHWRGKHRKGEVGRHLHFGWDLGPDRLSTEAAWELRDRPTMLTHVFGAVAQEAWDQRRLPAFYGNQAQVDFLRMCWPGGTMTLRQICEDPEKIVDTLCEMCDYPWNSILNIRKGQKFKAS